LNLQPTQILAFLTECDSPAAITSIASHLPQCPIGLRSQALDALYQGSLGTGARNQGSTGPGNTVNWTVSPATLDAIEAAFISELDENQIIGFRPNPTGGPKIENMRLADIAAYDLAQRFPAKYHFDINTPSADRDTQIAAIQSAYRQTHPQSAPTPSTAP